MYANRFGPVPRRRYPPPALQAAGDDWPNPGGPPPDDPPDGDDDLDESQRSALRHETRRAIFETVARTPGLNKRQVAQRVGVGRSLTGYHLDRLAAYDLLELLPSAREREVLCFHPDHTHLWEPEDTQPLYGRAPLRHVALYVHAHPGTTTKEIAEALDAAPRTIQEHLATLRDLGLVERHRFRHRVEHNPTERLEAWADDVGERYRRPWTGED